MEWLILYLKSAIKKSQGKKNNLAYLSCFLQRPHVSTNDSNDSRELLKATAEIFSEMVRDNLSKEALLLIYQKCHCQQLPLENARIVKTSDESHANAQCQCNGMKNYLMTLLICKWPGPGGGWISFRFVYSTIWYFHTRCTVLLYCTQKALKYMFLYSSELYRCSGTDD